MQFDFKVTAWERVNVDEKDEQKILQLIKEGKINSSADIFNHCDSASFEMIAETEEQMSVEENGGSSTIEVLDGQETIYTNEK
jgi:23S rRNA G2445 N2-methylase RlmL